MKSTYKLLYPFGTKWVNIGGVTMIALPNDPKLHHPHEFYELYDLVEYEFFNIPHLKIIAPMPRIK